MIEDAMKAVEAAEKNAAEKVQAAKAEADKIRKNSEVESEQLIKDAELKAKEDALSKMDASETERDVAVEKAKESARVKADALKQTAAGNEEAAIDAVINKLI